MKVLGKTFYIVIEQINDMITTTLCMLLTEKHGKYLKNNNLLLFASTETLRQHNLYVIFTEKGKHDLI